MPRASTVNGFSHSSCGAALAAPRGKRCEPTGEGVKRPAGVVGGVVNAGAVTAPEDAPVALEPGAPGTFRCTPITIADSLSAGVVPEGIGTGVRPTGSVVLPGSADI